MPKIAVIVAAKNAERTIAQCVESLLILDYPDYEVIVVDDGSSDQTPDILRSYKDKIKIITLSGLGPSAARNMAAKHAEAEYLAFTDSDCIADKSWPSELLKGFSNERVVAVGGKQEVPARATEFEKKVFIFMKKAGIVSDYVRKTKGHKIIEVRHNPSCNVMYKKDIFLEEGGFLEGLWPGEDVEFDYRLKKRGYTLLYNAKAIVYHHKPRTLKAFLTMMFRYGFAQGILVRKYGVFRTIHFLPLLSLVFLLLFLLAYAWNQSFALVLTASVCLAAILYYPDFLVATLFLLGAVCWNMGFTKGLFNADTCP